MTRSIGHLLLILVVLACPVQCVVAADACCATESSLISPVDNQTCQLEDDCCHHAIDKRESSEAGDNDSSQLPKSGDECHCDCLCKGAIAAVAQVDFNQNATSLATIDDCVVCSANEPSVLGRAHFDPPDPISGREIRTLQMSFQV